MKNSVFIATSLDGFIADINGGIGWLDSIPEINKIDTGYTAFTSHIDALVMGRKTFETVLSFGIEWPYKMPVFVLSSTLKKVPSELKQKVFVINGNLIQILDQIHQQGFHQLYIDGGTLIQNFIREDLIDEITITIIPILLGAGIPLFGSHSKSLAFECVKTTLFIDKIVQNKFVRVRS